MQVVGRQDLIRHVRQLLDTEHLVTLTGTAGIGKTTVAKLLCRHLHGEWVQMEGARDRQGFCDAVRQALGTDLPVREALQELGDRVLVLDNVEQVLPAAIEELPLWLRDAPKVRFLCTSRERLRVASECVVPVPPLSLPNPGEGATSEAGRLFLSRAVGMQSFDDSVLCELLVALEGIPLALELAAARVELLGLEGVREHLGRRLDLLARGHRDVSARQATMRGAIAWSWDLLDDDERDALLALAPLSGSFAVSDAAGLLGARALELVHTLVQRSLLTVPEPGRAALYASVRHFAMEHLQNHPAADAIWSRVAEWYVAAGEQHARAHEWHGAGLPWLRKEAHHLRAIADHCVANNDLAMAERAAGALSVVWQATGTSRSGLQLLNSLLQRTGPNARLLRLRGRCHRAVGDLESAERDLRTALDLADQPSEQADALQDLGLVFHHRRDMQVARGFYTRSLALHRAGEHHRAVAVTVGNLGALDHDGCAYDAASERYRQALDGLRRVGDRRLEGIFLCNAALLDLEQGRTRPAARGLRRALRLVRETGDPQFEAIVLGNLGTLHQLDGQLDAAQAHHEQALHLLAGLVAPRTEALCRARLGGVLAQVGEIDAADEHIEHAQGLLAGRDRAAARVVDLHLAFVDLAEGARSEASRRLSAARRPSPTGEPMLVEISDDARFAVRVLEGLLSQQQEREALQIRAGGQQFCVPDGSWQDLAPYNAARRIFQALVHARTEKAGAELDLQALFEAGWPGERIAPRSAANRVYVALARLRRMGLRDVIQRGEGGWFLDPSRPIVTI